jgi:hypothetical protein
MNRGAQIGRPKNIPQGLEARQLSSIFGLAEAVPFQDWSAESFIRHCQKPIVLPGVFSTTKFVP